MSGESLVFNVLDGTTHKAALAYLNTLRKIYDSIQKPIYDTSWRLSRIADEYCNTDFEDGVAISQNLQKLVEVLRGFSKGIDSLDNAVSALGKKEAESPNIDNKIERIMRDAIIDYEEMFIHAPNDEAERDIKERAATANAWLEAHGYPPEKVKFDKEEVPCL